MYGRTTNPFAGQGKQSIFNSVNCTYLLSGFVACCKKEKSEMYHDPLGYYWCPEHSYRGKLAQWGHNNNYPGIVFSGEMHYAMGIPGGATNDNLDLWRTVVLFGSEDMIRSALRYVEQYNMDL